MDSIAYTTLIKLLDEPMKALVVAGAVSSWFLIKKNSKLLDKTFELFDKHTQDLREANKEIQLTKQEMISTREKLVSEIGMLRKQILDTHAQIAKHPTVERIKERQDSLAQDLSDLKSAYGKVIILEQHLNKSDNDLSTTRRQLHEAIKILAKHKEKLSKFD
jgi:hypothetical protein